MESPFLETLAGWILEQYGKDIAALPRLLVLLPNRRACRSLQEAFLQRTNGKPMLLPRIQPIGDAQGDDFSLYTQSATIPAAISPIRRQLLLTKLVLNFEKNRQQKTYDVAQAAELARKLGQFLDDVAREGLTLDRLSTLVDGELAAHWQQTLDFLAIISHHWPQVLEGEGALDQVTHRNQSLLATARALKEQPPAYPVIAAGSTGSQPATAELLSVIARLPQGKVIMPGLDMAMPDGEWEMVAETHPQFALKQLLKRLGCARKDVNVLGADAASARMATLRAVFQPPEATSRWRELKAPLADGVKDMRLLEADTLLDEALMIAVQMRELLDVPGKSAALVTPDRTLARMVAAQMQRFGVTIDDSAGHRLADTAPGCFLRLAVEMVASQGAPSSLLALLRHPLAAGGIDPAHCRQLSRLLELELLRGIRKTPGIASLKSKHPPLAALLGDIEKYSRKLADCFAQKSVSLAVMLKAHIAFVEWLAGNDRLWSGEAGNKLAAFLAELLQHAELLPHIDPVSYPGLFESLLLEQSFWPRFGQHPRLSILSPMEARLQRFDKVILGGLNEGSWPGLPDADPWMSRPMRHVFGLPPAERVIGQSAHDFFLLCSSPEVVLTRARKNDGVPTVPSRWLVRMETLVGALAGTAFKEMSVSERYEQAKLFLDAPLAMEPLSPPAPVPPVAARPRQLRVTAIDVWLRDPYMIYAQYILKLKPLHGLDEEPGAADFGTVVHKALELFTRQYPKELPQGAYGQLLKYGREAFSSFIDRPAVACLWWPRFEAMAAWLLEQEHERRAALDGVYGELEGIWQFDVDERPFTLTTRIDRLEMEKSGASVVIDYKTGGIPTAKDIERGLANQLLLEALIANYGELKPAPLRPPVTGKLEYWKLGGNADACEIKPVALEGDAARWLEQARDRLMGLIRRFDNPAEAYAAQAKPTPYNNYEHLTRRQEWQES